MGIGVSGKDITLIRGAPDPTWMPPPGAEGMCLGGDTQGGWWL